MAFHNPESFWLLIAIPVLLILAGLLALKKRKDRNFLQLRNFMRPSHVHYTEPGNGFGLSCIFSVCSFSL